MATTKYLTKKTYGDKLLDPRWQKRRLEIFEREDYSCQYCGNKEKTLHVHHLCYNKNKDPWDIDHTALLCLCCDCHEVAHLSNLTDVESFLISEIQIRGLMLNGTDNGFNYFVRGINEYILGKKRSIK